MGEWESGRGKMGSHSPIPPFSHSRILLSVSPWLKNNLSESQERMSSTMEKLRKLRAMSRREISYRLREKLQTETERVRYYLSSEPEEVSSGFDPNDILPSRSGHQKAEFSVKRYLEEGPALRFYFQPSSNRDRLPKLLSHIFPGWMETTIEQAERLCQHRVEILGYGELELGKEIDWHRDPVSGRSWQRRYWADYDPVNDCRAGDPKRVHEINRHQHLPRLARAYYLTGEERYAREAVTQMESWIQQNPRSFGINWQSSLEIAIRAISWIWTLFFLLPSKSLDEKAARRISKSLFAQLDHVYRYPSIFSSPNTHLIGEATALFIGGVLFSELRRAAAWQRLGASLLVDQAEQQVLSEGTHGEFSSYYHCYTLDFYLQALALARRNRVYFRDWIWSRVGGMTEFVMHLTKPDGSIPLFGDDDGGRALALSATNYSSFRDGLCTAAVFLNRPDFKSQSGGFAEETLWLLGEEAWPAYNSLRSEFPRSRYGVYSEAGYFISRSGWGDKDHHLVFKNGEFGTLGGGHSHADALSIVLFAGGKELLVDPGTCVYNCAPDWRSFFRSTRAHNTVVIDGKDQSETGGTFSWNSRALTKALRHRVFSEGVYAEGEHSGYARLPGNIIHGRRLLSLDSGYAIVLDEFHGEGEHSFELYHHLSDEAVLSLRGGDESGQVPELNARIGETGLRLYICASGALQIETVHGQDAPIQGWVSHRYGEKRAAPVVRASFRGRAPAAFLTFLVPEEHVGTGHCPVPSSYDRLETSKSVGFSSPHGPMARVAHEKISYSVRCLEVKGGPGLACSIEHGQYVDTAIASLGESEVEMDEFSARGSFFWLRTENGIARRLLAFNARSFTREGNIIFANPDPFPYVSVRFGIDGSELEHGELEGKV